MPKAFDFTSAPFDRLRPAEMERVEAAPRCCAPVPCRTIST
jgi:hypothetical protein